MISTLTYVVFALLAVIFLTGCIIVIRNAIKIETTWKQLKIKLKEENKKQRRIINAGLQKKIPSINIQPMHQHSLN